ncbi:hypothetical protein HPP92_024887 [Vanilla planifolia]|uniref:Uncharacterized protein n=1 Tax=Vanilla planifolia TaxID=51239 RepID=A0A835PJ17_VANPL|nr:hypothetical protein HPP92_025172 [Vanilla planifolia]KAG0453583.1 hypothetical protein HPP92_024887 [Vanilla planifolia]
MNAVEGESAGIYRLTDGQWIDTMCNCLLMENGLPLRRTGMTLKEEGGRANHPWFSLDPRAWVFTSDYAGVSAEPISNPHHFQPAGEFFTVNIRIWRPGVSHNAYEDGTWAPFT